MSATLVGFLLAQIAADEAWAYRQRTEHLRKHRSLRVQRTPDSWRHILADCRARRRLVAEAAESQSPFAERVLRWLAVAYEDRPGYDPKWRP